MDTKNVDEIATLLSAIQTEMTNVDWQKMMRLAQIVGVSVSFLLAVLSVFCADVQNVYADVCCYSNCYADCNY